MFSRKANENMTIAERIHRDYMLEIERTFRRNGICHHLEYISDSDEAVKKRTADDDVEFDVMMVIDRHEYDLQVFHDNDRPGYAGLKQFRGEQPSPELRNVLSYWNFWEFISAIFFNVDLYVDPDRTVHALINELRNITKNSVRLKGILKFSQRGPVIQMDVHPDSWFIFWGPLLYSVDLVPAYQVDGTLFVSTPLKGETPKAMTWRQSSDQNSVNTGLAKETLKLNTKINDLETQLRQGNLMIYGLRGKPSATSEANEPINLALALFNNEMSVEVRHKDISKAYFLPSKDAERRPMLIQFNNPRVRGNILLARKALKTDSDDKKSRIYINEHLTSLNATLCTEARKLVKEKSLHSTWTRDGRIYIKRSESNTPPTRITSLND